MTDNDSTNIDDRNEWQTKKEFSQLRHRVTFSSDVEYDDEFCKDDCADDDEGIDEELASLAEIHQTTENSASETDEINEHMKFMTIHETICSDNNDDGNELNGMNDIVDQSECLDTAIIPKTIDEIRSTTHEVIESNMENIISLGKFNETILPSKECTKTNTHTDHQSIRRRPTSSKPIGVEKQHNQSKKRIISASAFSSNQNINPSNDVLKIHLNLRACCENKYLDNNRLPRYNGYISQYGLSKDQMEQRELNRRKFIEQRARHSREISRAKQEIEYLNEQAFRQWLIRKNHLARSKLKNMYDK